MTLPQHPYHHGALREALIEATGALLAERGAEGFSLREVARRAGVSPAAPAHHFGDAAGLLTAVATLGFDELARALLAGDARGRTPRARLREQGVEYVGFALRHPGRFRLMFRTGELRPDAALESSGRAAFLVLEGGVHRAFGVPADGALPAQAAAVVLALWSMVHGYAHLAIAGSFGPVSGGQEMAAFVQRTLRPMLDAALRGMVPAAPGARRAPRAAT
jgi:AcrR family transcriptional regulator